MPNACIGNGMKDFIVNTLDRLGQEDLRLVCVTICELLKAQN